MKKILSSIVFLIAFAPFVASAAIIYNQPDHSTVVDNPLFTHYITRECVPISSTDSLGAIAIWTGTGVDPTWTEGDELFVWGTNDPTCAGGAGLSEFDLTGTTPIQNLEANTRYSFDLTHSASSTTSLAGFAYLRVELYQGNHSFNNQCMGTTGLTSTSDIENNCYIQIFDSVGDTVGDSSTRIVSVAPGNKSTIATSTAATFAASGYINPVDFKTGMYIQIQYAFYGDALLPTPDPSQVFKTINFPIATSGPFVVSTTSPVSKTGEYTMQTRLKTPSLLSDVLSFLGYCSTGCTGGNIRISTSTTFVAVMPNGYDAFVASTTNSITAYLASSTISLASCSSWTSFSLGDCLNLLFVPQVRPIDDALSNFRNTFFSFAPWGYVTRVVVILSSNATSSLPLIDVTMPLGRPGSPEYMVDEYKFDPNDMLSGGALLLNRVHTSFGGDFSVQEVMEPFVDFTIAMLLISYIFYDLLKMRGGHRKTASGKLH